MTSAARGAERDRCQPRRTAQAFLRAGVNRVDLPGVNLDRDAAERGDGVERDQRAGIVGDLGNLLDRLPGTRGRLRVDDSDHLRAVLLDRRADLLGIEDLAVRPFDGRHFGPGAGRRRRPCARRTRR